MLLGIAGLLLLGYIAQQSLMNVYVIYADYRYHWTDRTVGLSLATIGIFSGLYGALFVKRVVAWLGERRTMVFGFIGGAAGYAMFGLSATGLLFWMAIPVLNMMSFTWPSAQSLMSHEIGPSEQGQLQGRGEQSARHRRTSRAGFVYLYLQHVDWGACSGPFAGDAVLCCFGNVGCRFGTDGGDPADESRLEGGGREYNFVSFSRRSANSG